jgi:flagellar biosynthesis GTPase FlhF
MFAHSVLADDLPTLDDLLDLDVPDAQKKPVVEDKPIDPDAVTAQQGRNALERAVGRMQDVASRMGNSRDVSISLQRQQEEIIKDLDQVIAAAKKQQQEQQSSSSSSSSSSQQQQQNQQDSAKQNSQKRSDASKSNKQTKSASEQQTTKPSSNAGDTAASMATQQPGSKAQPMESGKVEWGNLPPRLRDELMQGTQERFSPVYEKQTEAYYRRLAEEAK